MKRKKVSKHKWIEDSLRALKSGKLKGYAVSHVQESVDKMPIELEGISE